MKAFNLIVIALLIGHLGVAGCAAVQPWEREYLADEIMQFDPDELEASWNLHVHEVLEGGRGGFSGAGGGCGCK